MEVEEATEAFFSWPFSGANGGAVEKFASFGEVGGEVDDGMVVFPVSVATTGEGFRGEDMSLRSIYEGLGVRMIPMRDADQTK